MHSNAFSRRRRRTGAASSRRRPGRLGTSERYVEKEFWVCWALDALFNDRPAGEPRQLFKGGTSLSKAFGLISRFSEDIDITVFRDLDATVDGAFSPAPSNAMLAALERDYTNMRGIIFGEVPQFSDIVARIRLLEDQLRR